MLSFFFYSPVAVCDEDFHTQQKWFLDVVPLYTWHTVFLLLNELSYNKLETDDTPKNNVQKNTNHCRDIIVTPIRHYSLLQKSELHHTG